MQGFEQIETPRLLLRRPTPTDAETIFKTYASDAEVTRFLSWPRHCSLNDTRCFLEMSDREWERWPVGPYLIALRDSLQIIGSTGLSFETPTCASIGYVLAKRSWGNGYATEALQAMITLGYQVQLSRLYALCHSEHHASRHVLEKCGFTCEAMLSNHTEFPNLGTIAPCDVVRYSLAIAAHLHHSVSP